jgi:hypothetical protein
MRLFNIRIREKESLPAWRPARGRLAIQGKQGGFCTGQGGSQRRRLISLLLLLPCWDWYSGWCRYHGVGTGYLPCVDIRVSAMDTSRESASRCRDWILPVCWHHGVRERILFAQRTRLRIRLLNCALMAVGAIDAPLVCWLRVPSRGWVRVLLYARVVS